MNELFKDENWQLLLQNKYVVQSVVDDPSRYIPLPSVTLLTTSKFLLIGGRSDKAKANWYLAASINPLYNFSLINSMFTTAIQLDPIEQRIPLNRLTLINIESYQVETCLLEIKIPYWHEEIDIEVWQFKGTNNTISIDKRLFNIEAQLEDIKEKLNVALG